MNRRGSQRARRLHQTLWSLCACAGFALAAGNSSVAEVPGAASPRPPATGSKLSPAQFGFKPVDPAELQEAPFYRDPSPRPDIRPSPGLRISPGPSAGGSAVPRSRAGRGSLRSAPPETRGFAVERLPDLQTQGRSLRLRSYGSLTGSSGRSRGVGSYP